MRWLTGISKNGHGSTYVAREKIPAHLQEALARVLANDKKQQVWLQRSLATKDSSELTGALRLFRSSSTASQIVQRR